MRREPTTVAAAPVVAGDDVHARSASARTRAVLAAACLGQLMVVLDISVVNVALPSIDASLGFTPTSLSWVVSGYTLSFAGLLLLGGRIADLLGHRRTLLSALALFGVASVLGGVSQSPGQLIAARAAQGVAAAVLSPATLSVIMVTYREGAARRHAIAMWGMVATGGSALGVLLSGLLTEYLGWRWVLFVNVPFVIAAAALTLAAVRMLPLMPPGALDVFGAILATASMTLLAHGCVHAGEQGWGDVATVGSLTGALLSGLAFVGWELRADAPLVRLPVLKARAVWVAAVVTAFIGAAVVGGFYFASLSLQNVLGYDPLHTGLAFLPFCGGMALATIASSRLVQRFGARTVITAGLTVGGLGMLCFARLDADAGFGTFLVASIPASTGLGVCIAPTLSLGTSGVVRGEAGMVSGLLNAGRQAGGSVALAALAALTTAAASGPRPADVTGGYHVAFVLSGLALLTAATVALTGVPRGPTVTAHEKR